MNLFKKSSSPGCVKHCGEEIVCGSPQLMVEQRFFCGPSSSSSSTAQSAQNQQVALQTAQGAPGVAIGAGASTGAVGITSNTDSGNTVISGDTLTARDALVLANNTITQDQAAGLVTQQTNAALAGHSIDAQNELVSAVIQSASDMAGQSIVAAAGQADRAEGTVATIAGAAIDASGGLATTVSQLASNLGGSAINLASGVASEAFTFAQNESVLNYNALNQNTALAFSTIAALSTAQASGAISAEAADLARLAGQIGNQSGGTTTVVNPATPYTTTPVTTSDTGGVSAGTLTMIGIVLAALYFLFPKGAKQLTG